MVELAIHFKSTGIGSVWLAVSFPANASDLAGELHFFCVHGAVLVSTS